MGRTLSDDENRTVIDIFDTSLSDYNDEDLREIVKRDLWFPYSQTELTLKEWVDGMRKFAESGEWQRLAPDWQTFLALEAGVHSDVLPLLKTAEEFMQEEPELVVSKLAERMMLSTRINQYHSEGKTQEEMAVIEDVNQSTISRNKPLCKNPVITQKMHKPKRVYNPRVVIETGTLPENAAMRIRERLGDDYAEALADALRKA